MGALFVIDILNGLLPCGFVYVGLAGSLTTGSILEGASYMALIGFGTFPVMLVLSLAPHIVGLNMRQRITRFIPVFARAFGIFLVFRGIMVGGH